MIAKEEITDTQRLDFILENGGKWQGFSASATEDAYQELQIWSGGRCEEFEAATRRDCVDKAIIKKYKGELND